jgi:hypothetical protein
MHHEAKNTLRVMQFPLLIDRPGLYAKNVYSFDDAEFRLVRFPESYYINGVASIS